MELPSIRQLECLVAVAETLSFRKAAEACHITQPALSAQIQQLETRLGVRLFERDRRRVLATAVGEALTAQAHEILARLHDLTESAAAWQAPLSGTLKLGVIPTVAPYVLPRAMDRVARTFPKLRLLLHEGRTSQLVEMLEDGALDVLLLALEVDLGDAATLPLMVDRFVLAVPAGHRLANRKRVSEKDLRDEQVLLLTDGHCLRDQALSICATAGASELGDFRASSLTTLVQMVAGGVGVTLLPEISLPIEAGPERKLALIPFSARGPARMLGLAWRAASSRAEEYKLLGNAIRAGMA